MAADPETLARIDGKPLLSEEGMSAIDSLLAAHVDYDSAEAMNSAEIVELSNEIVNLESKRAELVAEAKSAVDVQQQARHSHSFDVTKAVANPKKSVNPVYATVIKAVASDGQMGLWYPRTLEAADKMGRSLVEFDETLGSTRKPLPALVIDREKSGHTNLYIAQTKRSGRLEPATMPVKERRGVYSTTIEQRDALALPVNEKKIVGLQVHPNNFGKKDSLADHTYGKGPGLRELEDSFKILLPQGHLYGESYTLGTYDSSEGIAEIEGASNFMSRGTPELAIGTLAVTKAIVRLRQEFADNTDAPYLQQPAFDQLTELAFGNLKLPRPSAKQPRHVATNSA